MCEQGNMVDVIIGLIGPVCAGKTTLARAWERQFDWVANDSWSARLQPWVKPAVPIREDYTSAAMAMVEERGMSALADIMLADKAKMSKRVAIADAPRWMEHIQCLRHTSIPCVMVYVDAPVFVRWQRQRTRARFPGDAEMSLQAFWLAERNTFSEAFIPELRSHADLYVENVATESEWLERSEQLLRDCLWMVGLEL